MICIHCNKKIKWYQKKLYWNLKDMIHDKCAQAKFNESIKGGE